MFNESVSIMIKGSLSAEDYLVAMRLHMHPRPLYLSLGVALIGLGLYIMIYLMVFLPWTIANVWSASVIFICLSMLGIYFFIFIPQQCKRRFDQQKLLHEDHILEITPDFLISSSGQTYRKVRWDIFYNYKYSKRMFLLYQSEAMFNIFPRRWFSSDADYDLFVSYIQGHVKCDKKWQSRLA